MSEHNMEEQDEGTHAVETGAEGEPSDEQQDAEPASSSQEDGED